MQSGTVSKNKNKSGSDYSDNAVFHLPQVPDIPIAGSSHGHKVTFRSLIVRPQSISSKPHLVPQPVPFNVLRIPDSKTSGKDTDSEAKVRIRTPHQKVKKNEERCFHGITQSSARGWRIQKDPLNQKYKKLKGRYSANAMLVFNSWLKDIEMCMKEWKWSNMEAVLIIKRLHLRRCKRWL